MKITTLITTLLITLFFVSCSHKQVDLNKQIPPPSSIQNVAIYTFENYTDTPRAGMRAANLTEGILLSKGYTVVNNVNTQTLNMSYQEKVLDAKRKNYRYLFTGGLSEWRYKTGIDGEPAISLHLKLIELSTNKIIWSAVGSDNSWGNASIGTVAQELISSML